ncbi:cytochrome c oxidase assembly protein COX16 homolog l(3)neo43 isoform X3 [Bombus vancouverensis nearcticus]|uniref:cytochrome c oxidase assembly protein COX16 homolog l(3)neo43 isoform X3 n=1 Tax=Bombus vancouverensis nearcticus TaxID=2705178 RepID=UPI00402BF0A6
MISYRHIYKNITFNTMKQKRFWQFLPFMILVIGGTFFIQEFVSLKYKYPKVTSHDLKIETKKRGIEMKKSRTLEEEYKLIELDISRPWILIIGKTFVYHDHGRIQV